MPVVASEALTQSVMERWSGVSDPRLRQVMTRLVHHLHEFTCEVEPSLDEWRAAIQFLTRLGQKCDDRRQEWILLSDILGVSMLVDAINNRPELGATPTTVEGPFHVAGSPEMANGDD